MPAVADSLPFSVGEKLTYSVEWLLFDAGRMELSISETPGKDGENLMRFGLHTATTKTLAKIFRMDDRFSSYWNANKQLPEKLVVKIRESYTTTDKVVEFNHEGGKAMVTKNGKDPEEKELDPKAQDFLSSGHFTRTFTLVPGTKIIFPVFEDEKNYNTVIKVIKKERIRIMGGELDTVMIIPKLKFEGAFQSMGTLYVWLTDDEFKVPVRFKLKIIVGTIVVSLIGAEGVELNMIKK